VPAATRDVGDWDAACDAASSRELVSMLDVRGKVQPDGLLEESANLVTGLSADDTSAQGWRVPDEPYVVRLDADRNNDH
jgi:hypothetical protein